MISRAWPHLLVALLATVAVLAVASRAGAATAPTYSTACSDAAVLDTGLCAVLAERLELVEMHLQDVQAGLSTGSPLELRLAAIQSDLEAAPPAATATSLDAAATQRLDLIWTGVWFTGGAAFGVWSFRRLGREATRWGGGV